MDPNANLTEQLELAEYINDENREATDTDDLLRLEDKAKRLAELVQALDEWILKGGFFPERWLGGWLIHMRRAIAKAMGIEVDNLPGFEASVYALCSEATTAKKNNRQLELEVQAAALALASERNCSADDCRKEFRETALNVLAFEADKGDIDLDEHVHELKAQEAADINNAGRGTQLSYLLEKGGLDWVEELLKEDDES